MGIKRIEFRFVIRLLALPPRLAADVVAGTAPWIDQLVATVIDFKMQVWAGRIARTAHYAQVFAFNNRLPYCFAG